MPKKKNVLIKYTNRDFKSIKDDLVDYARRYYPDSYRDFTTPSFGSMVLDNVAYVGDILSYYLDYSINESFLDTSIEFDNIKKHARSLGFNFHGTPSSYGVVTLYILCPANTAGTAPDVSFLPVLKRGAVFGTHSGANFVLTEDVVFNRPENDVVAARMDSTTGATTYFAVRAYGQIQSGVFEETLVQLDSKFEKFKKVRVGTRDVTEIYSVTDSAGNKYYEVDNLAQEVVFIETTNDNAASDGVRSILKPFVATRRFVVEQDNTGTFLQFGYGSEEEDSIGITDPAKIAIKMHGKKQISNNSFDPTKLLSTNKFGIAPYNTTLKIVYRTNNPNSVNAGGNTIRQIPFANLVFNNPTSLNSQIKSFVESSLEVSNEEPINGFNNDLSAEELKVRAKSYYATQNRAVTKQDYESIIYQMPPKFGSIRRVNMVNDPSSSNRKITLYVISQHNDGYLDTANSLTKNNMKNWLTNYISINDSIEIKDAIVVNFKLTFKVMYDRNYDPDAVLFACKNSLTDMFSETFYIGEPLYLTSIYDNLNRITGVVDVKKVAVESAIGGTYSSTTLNFDNIMSKDGTFVKVPKNVILELRYPNIDLKGTVV